MPVIDCIRTTPVVRSHRVQNLEGMFELPPNQQTEKKWKIDCPIEDREWNIGLIVGASGSGKTTVAKELFAAGISQTHHWSGDRSILDDFPSTLGIKEIVGILSSVGFSSPPSWLRPYHCLSNGEQFRVSIARAIAESTGVTVVDEFTSVVDRQVAQVCSASVAKNIRAQSRRFVAVSCHYDIIDWLTPDWVLEMPSGEFTWRSLRRRPAINLEIKRVTRHAWELFRHHHYLDHSLHHASKCFCAFIQGKPVALTGVLYFPHPKKPGWREHRTVCLPDYQGVGIGNAMSEYVASLFASKGIPYRSTTSNPAMMRHRAKSKNWRMIKKPGLNQKVKAGARRLSQLRNTVAASRFTASFEYIGISRHEQAERFGI